MLTFFVLSGFLITFLLIREYEKNNTIDVINFYFRRILRIWPLYFFVAFIGYFGYHFVKKMMGDNSVETADPLLAFTFLNNFNAILNGHPISTILSVLWSVAIEEQFYLIWPVFFYFGVRFKVQPYILVGVIIFSTGWCYLHSIDKLDLAVHTFACSIDLSVGVLAAYALLYSKFLSSFLKDISHWHIGGVYFLFFGLWIFRYVFVKTSLYFAYHLIYSIVFIGIILEHAFSINSFFKFGSIPFASYLGRISYGLYMLHMLAILFVSVIAKKTWYKRRFIWNYFYTVAIRFVIFDFNFST